MSAEAIGALLAPLNAVPGVVGSMVCGEQGKVLAAAFPASLDPGTPARAARVLADHGGGLAAIGGAVSAFTLRFAGGRLLVRPVGPAHLVVLCTPTANPQPVALLAAATAPRLERLVALPPRPTAAAPAPAPRAPGRLWQLVQRIEAVIARKRLDPFRTRGAISMAAGVGLRAIDEDTPDDPGLQAKLEAAAKAVLGEAP